MRQRGIFFTRVRLSQPQFRATIFNVPLLSARDGILFEIEKAFDRFQTSA